MEEITLGTGLTMVGTTLSSTGGGGGSVSELSDLADVNTSTPTNRNALIADGVDFESRALVEADISDLGTYLASTDIDTLAELNAIVTDATLIDTADARLSDSRTPTSHGSTHLTAGGDAIQLATNAQEGLASAAQITAIEANTAASHAAATKSGTGTYVTLSAQDIVVDPIDPADLSATGTPSASTYLRGDNTWSTVSGSGDFLANGTVPMTGDIDCDGNNIDDSGVLFQREQAAADADVAAQGQWWTLTATPNRPMFTDDSGQDFELLTEVVGFACSDETTALTTGEKVKLDIPFDFLVTRVFATLATAGTTSATTVDVQDETVSILNAVISITQATNNAETSTFASAATEYQLTKGDALSIDINAVDSGATDAGLKVFLEGVRT